MVSFIGYILFCGGLPKRKPKKYTELIFAESCKSGLVYSLLCRMPPKRKQTPHNGFYYFMQDFKNRQGKHFRSMQEVADAAGPHWKVRGVSSTLCFCLRYKELSIIHHLWTRRVPEWLKPAADMTVTLKKNMSKEQRKPYEEKALMQKNNMRVAKMTSDGLDVEQLEMEDKRELQRTQAMKEDINFNLNVAAKSGRLHRETFFIIHINIFCHWVSEDRYYPAEIAIAGFSLDEGVKENCVFHRIIKPGPLPLGYACEANLHSKETHQLPPPMSGDTEYNMEEVYFEMRHFIKENCGSSKHPVLYTEKKKMNMVQQILDTMSFDFEEKDNIFKVYNLEIMFKVLRNKVADETIWPTDTYSMREIEKDVYAHAHRISCELHENTEAIVHCSQSIVKRYAFIICDNCCPDLQIELIPGKHIPMNSRQPSMRSSSMLSLNSQSSRYSTNLKPTTRDDDSESVVSFSSKSGWESQSLVSDTSSSFGPPKVTSDDFPPLGGDGLRSSWKSNASSIPAPGSYAGIMGTSGLGKKTAASSLCDDLGNVDINDTASEASFTTSYPALGKGRGKRARN